MAGVLALLQSAQAVCCPAMGDRGEAELSALTDVMP